MTETSTDLLIHQMPLGTADNFVYLLADRSSKDAVVVDPAWDIDAILQAAEKYDYSIAAIWLTHGHHDHTNAVEPLLGANPTPIYLSRRMPKNWRPEAASIIELVDGDTVHVGSVPFTVYDTPGHSPDGICFLSGRELIAGDTLFIDGCGRCDLPTSDVNAMYDSIHGKLMKLPDDTRIWPGHNYGPTPTDTLGAQKRTNRFMLADTREAFVRERLG